MTPSQTGVHSHRMRWAAKFVTSTYHTDVCLGHDLLSYGTLPVPRAPVYVCRVTTSCL